MTNKRIHQAHQNFKNMIGLKYNRLQAVELSHFEDNFGAIWKFKCDCGNFITTKGAYVRSGDTKSCGCLHLEVQSKRIRCNQTHGLSGHRLYNLHGMMLTRCSNIKNKDYHRYGGRGITVCDEWKDIKTFIEWANSSGYSPGLTIERKNYNGNYCPENCTWIPNCMQGKNTSTQHIITFNGKSMDRADWSRETGIPQSTLFNREKAGWSIKRMLTTPRRF